MDAYNKTLQEAWHVVLDIIIAVEEIEAWFLCVPEFFTEYDENLTLDTVNGILGINLSATAVEAVPHPSAKIDEVLSTVGQRYRKRLGDSYRIANVPKL